MIDDDFLGYSKFPVYERVLYPQASASANGDFISIETLSDTKFATVHDIAPEHVLMPDASNLELGRALLSALSLSRLIALDDPAYTNEACAARYDAWVKEKMDRFGYKTKSAFFRQMDNCSIEIRDGVLTISPSYHYRLDGWSGDFIDKKDYVRIPADSSPEEVGAALRLAFSRCKTKGFGSVSLKKKPKKSDGA
ncbi:MAG: CdiI family contact-dependent growth inhibition immunity protein [Proteobacteria bacterium]|nr:CdiI family contact-dependent growth inhibition immunity protein [Pseudomonadota bacterium]